MTWGYSIGLSGNCVDSGIEAIQQYIKGEND